MTIEIEFCWKLIFEILIIHKPSPGSQNLGPIGRAVLTFIGYKQTDTQTDKQSL